MSLQPFEVDQLRRLTVLIWLCVLPSIASATLVTFDFEEFPAGEALGALVSNGFVFDPGIPGPNAAEHYAIFPAGLSSDPNGPFYIADNGTQYLGVDYFLNGSILNIYRTDHSVFGMKQFDLAGQLEIAAFVLVGLTFTGWLADGGTISEHTSFDGTNDGTGPLNDFQSFAFDEQWDRLTLFTIVPSHEYANPGIDNVVLRVPEPGALSLLVGGLLLLAWRSRRAIA